jgi:hypothetical protein
MNDVKEKRNNFTLQSANSRSYHLGNVLGQQVRFVFLIFKPFLDKLNLVTKLLFVVLFCVGFYLHTQWI